MIQGSPEWHAKRRLGIGGSDAAAVACLSPRRTPTDVYFEKISEETVDNSNEDTRRGQLLEPAVRQMYSNRTGRTVIVPDDAVVNPNIGFIRANLDGIASGTRVVQIKTSRDRSGWGEDGSSDVPVEYLCQVQHEMLASGLHVADVPVLFGDFEFCVYTVDADLEFQQLLLDQEMAFWHRVIQRIPPEPVTTSDLKKRWPRHVIDATEASGRDIAAARALRYVKLTIKELEAVQDQCEFLLKSSIKDAEGLTVDGKPICTWKSAKDGSYFDKQQFQRENPALYERYLRTKDGARTFLVKGNHECLETTTSLIPPKVLANLLPQAEAEAPVPVS
jgi:putative phage-type endonuclease